MKKRKLKSFVLPTVYVLVMALVFVSISFLGTSLQEKIDYDNLSVNAIKDDKVTPVVSTDDEKNTVEVSILKPFVSDKVVVSKSYYDIKDDESRQQQSLVYYEKTYLQNSGILYTSDEAYEIQAVMDGTVTNVTKDEILGNVVEITHNTNLKTVYYSLSEINVKKDDSVNAGTVIGKSGDNNLTGEKENCLLFEVYYNGSTMDPDDFYNMSIKDLQ
ncbi:MAG: M23 family metallopeptidase [Bacilli bacterium]|nr:M23 family metallopeptidase [Bacilli bacterium]